MPVALVMVLVGMMVMVVLVVAWLLVMLHSDGPDAIQTHLLQEALQTVQRDGSVLAVPDKSDRTMSEQHRVPEETHYLHLKMC